MSRLCPYNIMLIKYFDKDRGRLCEKENILPSLGPLRILTVGYVKGGVVARPLE